MRSTADAVVIGGGIVGAATAFYLAREKAGQVVLLEKEEVLGTHATSKAAGGIRAQFTTKVNIEMSMLAERIFERFEDETGFPALFDQVGYMFLLYDDESVATFKKAYELQRSLGLDVQILQPDEIAQYAPHVSLEGVKMATFCKQDGLGDPHEFLSGYEKGARKLGVEVNAATEVTGISVDGGKITSVQTNKGDISTPLVVNCAGPFARLIGQMVGAEVKIEPVRRQIVTTSPLDFVKPHFPMVVSNKTGLYSHKESGGMLLGWANRSVEPSFDISIDPEYSDGILERALELMPQLEEAEIANQWAGLYEVTPDHHGIVGWEPAVEGMFHCAGFSGHGFMHAPAGGLVTAQVITGQKPSVDIEPLSPQRFGGDIVEETNVI